MTDTLFDEPIVAHCFYGCGGAVSGFHSDDVHDRMELHYAKSHPVPICRVTGHRAIDDTMYRCKLPVGHDGRHHFGDLKSVGGVPE